MSAEKDEEKGLVGGQESEGDSDEEDVFAKSRRAAACYEDADEVEMKPIDMDEDTFGMSVCSLTRDTCHLSRDGCSCARVTRLLTSLFLVFVTIGMQVALLGYVKSYVSARAVHNIRVSYSLYEDKVYGCTSCSKPDPDDNDKCLTNLTETGKCTKTINGNWRGKRAMNGYPEKFPGPVKAAALLDTIEADHQDAICHIPLSQPEFFGLILVIWVLSSIKELKKAVNLAWVILMLPRTDSMANAIESTDDGEVISAMTCFMKVLIVTLTFVPRVTITIYLGWVGMRWLLATTAFSDLILNAVALEFVLYIKEVIYGAVMPTRSEHDLANTKIIPHPRRMSAAWWNFTSSVSLLFWAFLIVFLYMKHWQQVLPNYNWDVHEVCKGYIKKQYAV